jgi:DNA (cytosine-5)-methyltransferase 1
MRVLNEQGADSFPSYILEDVRRAADQKLFTVVSTFAGGGGSSLGYRLAGGHVLAMNEFQEEATNTYSANTLFAKLPETKMLARDIRHIDGEDLLNVAGLKKKGLCPKKQSIKISCNFSSH